MQIHRNDMITTGGLQHIRHKLRSDGSSTLVLLVLARVGEIRQDGGDAARGGGAAGVDQDEEFHDVVVDVAGFGGLDDEDVLVADGLADGDAGFVVAVLEDHDFGELDAESAMPSLSILFITTCDASDACSLTCPT